MEFVNRSGVSAGWTMGFDREGRELIVVVVKATYMIPKSGDEPRLLEEQAPLITADTFSGEPGLSAPVLEVDYAHRKLACDVLLNGTAYAPASRPVTEIEVGLKVGTMIKPFLVVGNRRWQKRLLGTQAGAADPFISMPISYDNAFGGTDFGNGDPGQIKTYLANPVGKGFVPSRHDIDGHQMPNTEEIRHKVNDPAGNYRPMSFGPIGRNWLPRMTFAGTYDEEWVAKRAPFWPDDFDDRYFQAAPPDQQIPFPIGGEEVALKNLTPDGLVYFRLPHFAPSVLFVRHKSIAHELKAMTDTILIEPDQGTFSMTARASMPMRKNCFELASVVAGQTAKDWFGRKRFGQKPYYRNLAELARARIPKK